MILAASSQAAETARMSAEDACSSADELDLSVPEALLPEACDQALRCILESRLAAELQTAPAADGSSESICDRLSRISGLSKPDLDQMLDDLRSREGDLSDESVTRCESLLLCLNRSRSDRAASADSLGTTWKDEFDRVCGQVPIASQRSAEQLEDLLLDCDRLKSSPALLEDPRAKLFLRRIEMCRSFFEYSLELQKGDG